MRYVHAAVLACLMCGPTALAGSQTGQVTQIIKRASDGIIYFHMSGPQTNRPSCAASTQYWMIKDENSDTGKQQLSMLLAARASGQEITVIGSDTCVRWFNGEDVNYVMF